MISQVKHVKFVVLFSLEYRKTPFTFLPDTRSQHITFLRARTREQVLSWDEEVVEFTAFQVGHKILQEQLKTVAQTWGAPISVFSSGAAGV